MYVCKYQSTPPPPPWGDSFSNNDTKYHFLFNLCEVNHAIKKKSRSKLKTVTGPTG